ncbi:hypothetical protein E2C01_101534 [Portunus trituberculatus]|uniref:Uncharacterized protein n=1 Tax=Portunus trituberculatus TaxID=210409 RepID=A0A5B7KF01_PORTR|nr:hypothetical protein [Portunus trituberculatus]
MKDARLRSDASAPSPFLSLFPSFLPCPQTSTTNTTLSLLHESLPTPLSLIPSILLSPQPPQSSPVSVSCFSTPHLLVSSPTKHRLSCFFRPGLSEGFKFNLPKKACHFPSCFM